MVWKVRKKTNKKNRIMEVEAKLAKNTKDCAKNCCLSILWQVSVSVPVFAINSLKKNHKRSVKTNKRNFKMTMHCYPMQSSAFQSLTHPENRKITEKGNLGSFANLPHGLSPIDVLTFCGHGQLRFSFSSWKAQWVCQYSSLGNYILSNS